MDPERIKKLRKKLGVSVDVFARAMGVCSQSVQRWECGLRNPSGTAIILLGEFEGGLRNIGVNITAEQWAEKFIQLDYIPGERDAESAKERLAELFGAAIREAKGQEDV